LWSTTGCLCPSSILSNQRFISPPFTSAFHFFRFPFLIDFPKVR
jgi:hypothetical protein